MNRQDLTRIDEFLDGELSPTEVERFKESIASSPSLKAELATAKKLKELLGKLTAPSPSSDYFEEVTEIIMARTADLATDETYPTNRPVRPIRSSVVTISIQLAASMILFFGALSLSQSKQTETAVVMPMDKYRLLEARSGADLATAEWELSESELAEVAIGITAVSTPGRASGFSTLSDVISVRYR